MKTRLDTETGYIERILEDGELWCQGCEDVVVKEEYECQCSVCEGYFCPKCSATKDDETLVCIDCLELLCGLPDELKKVKAGIEEIESQAKQASEEMCDFAALNMGAASLRLGRIQGTCKVLLALLPKEKK